MMRKYLEPAIVVIAAVAAFLLTDLGGYWMPPALVMWAASVVVVGSIAIGAFFFFDRVRDEREEIIRNAAARLAYGLGLGVLLVGIAYRALTHTPADSWALAAVVVMIATIVTIRARRL